MSFVIAQPDFVTAAAEDLASIRAALTEAAASASAPTSALAAAGADEVSAAIAQMFGAYGQEFQTFNAQAAAFHTEFVNLLNGSGAAYLSTELANAQRTLVNAANAGQAAAAGAVAAEPLLTLPIPIPPLPPSTGGGLGGLLGGSGGILGPVLFGGSEGLLGGLIGGGSALSSLIGSSPLAQAFGQFGGAFGSALLAGNLQGFLTSQLANIPGLGPILQGALPGLFGSPPPPGQTGPPLNAWQKLFIHTSQNLAGLNQLYAADPNPLGGAISHNWAGYAYETNKDWAATFQNLPFELEHLPYTLQNGAAGLASFDAAKYIRISAAGTTGALNTMNTSFSAFNTHLNENLTKFPSEWALVNQDISAGHYNLAVTDGTKAVLNLFLNGFDTSNLNDIKLEGPVADLFPVLSLPGQQLLGASTLMTYDSVGQHMVANAGKFFTALSDTSVSANVAVQVDLGDPINLPPILPSVSLQMNAFFGLPLSLLFGIGGAPVAMLDGIATSGQIIGAGMLTGNPSQVFGGINDMPAYALDGLLNGEAIVDVPLPVTISTGIPVLGEVATIPIVAHLPFDGLLVPPHPLKATIPLQVAGVNIPVELTLGGTKFGGLASLLTNNGFRILADAITNTP